MAKRKDITSAYRWAEKKIIKYFPKFTVSTKIKTAVYVRDGHYHNDGEYENPKEALYALTCFLEDYLGEGLKQDRKSVV